MQTTLTENILNVTLLEPRQKHPTIFLRFDELSEGESLTILNDHDPKPLYYQLLGERGNIFNWEYLEQGPVWWRVRIGKRLSGEQDETLGQLAAKDLRKAKVFKKYGLDFCCGGQKTVNTHHAYVRKTLPEIRMYATKVRKVHGGRHPELVAVDALVSEINEELNEHLKKEEAIVFPYIKALGEKDFSNEGPDLPEILDGPIDLMEAEHEIVGRKLATIRELTKDYTLPEDACASYSLLYRMLEEFEEDLHLHIHLENNILFPKALALEKQTGHEG
jgi:regulator of cell morphogenesis and NO signaling